MATIVVGNSAQLSSALNSAKAGDTIVLKSGDYGKVDIIGKNFAGPVTITSESSTDPAKFTGLEIRNASNVKLDGIKFDYVSKYGAPLFESPFAVFNSKGVSIANSVFDGDVAKGISAADNGYGTGRGLYVTGSSDIDVVNNDFHGFFRGMVIRASTDVNVSRNEISDMASDGINLSEVKGVTVSQNHIHDFHRSATSTAHPDMIQVMSANVKIASSDIKIVDNLLDQGQGVWTQSIFMRNEAVQLNGGGIPMYYKDILVANNIIRNSHSHGITIGESIGTQIRNNTIILNPDADFASVPSINVAAKSQGVLVSNNLTSAITAVSKAGWTVTGNQLLQNENHDASNYIGNVFTNPFDKLGTSWADFKFLPNNTMEKLGVGSTLSKFTGSVSGVILNENATDINSLIQKFDASYVVASGGKINLAGATVTWDYGDGQTGSGLLSNHVYDKAGTYNAKVTIVLANGQSFSAEKTIVLKDTAMLHLEFENGAKDTSGVENEVLLGTKAKVLSTADGKKVLDLNGGFVTIKTDPDFYENSKYTFVADFKKDAGAEGKTGRLAYFNGSLIVTVKADGIEAIIRTTKGNTVVKADNLGIKDTDWHRVGVTFDGDSGYVKLFLDGKQVSSIAGLEGATQTSFPSAKFYIGSPFGNSFDGKIDNVHFYGEALPSSMLSPDSTLGSKVSAASQLAKVSAAASLMASSDVEAYVASKTVAPAPMLEAAADLGHAEAAVISHAIHQNATDTDFRLV